MGPHPSFRAEHFHRMPSIPSATVRRALRAHSFLELVPKRGLGPALRGRLFELAETESGKRTLIPRRPTQLRERGRYYFLVRDSQGKQIATFMLGRVNADYAYWGNFVIDPTHQNISNFRHGYMAAEKLAKGLGCRYLLATVAVGTPLHRTMTRFGYVMGETIEET